MMEANSEEQDAAIRQLLASRQGGGRSDSADDLLGGRSNISDIDMAAALANCSG